MNIKKIFFIFNITFQHNNSDHLVGIYNRIIQYYNFHIMKNIKIIKNGFELGYIKTDNFGKQWIWSGNAFYSHEPDLDIEKCFDSESIKAFIKIGLLLKQK